MKHFPEASAYQKIRLWSGITSIGFNLCLILIFAITSAWWASLFHSPGVEFLFLGALALGISMANLPFDLLCGFAIESGFHHTKQSFAEWFRDWMMGRGLASLGLFFSFALFWWNHSTEGAYVLVLLVFAGLVLISGFLTTPTGFHAPLQSPESRFEGAIRDELLPLVSKTRDIRWFDNGEKHFVNGFLSPSGTLCLSTTVAKELTPRQAALLAAREEWFRTSRLVLVEGAIVVLWALVGLLLALIFPATTNIQAAICGAAIVTCWCFLALFIWPSLNRKWMAMADRHLLTLATRDEVSDLLSKIQALNTTDVALPAAKTAVFHPIAPLEDRLKALS